MREVARQAGVSHNAAYRHFTNREELLQAVDTIGLTEPSDRMRLRMNEVVADNPMDRSRLRLSAVGAAYVAQPDEPCPRAAGVADQPSHCLNDVVSSTAPPSMTERRSIVRPSLLGQDDEAGYDLSVES